MVLGLVAITAVSILMYFPTSKDSADTQTHDHGFFSEIEAVHFPLEITQYYTGFETTGDTDEGAGHLKIYDNVIDTERNCEFCLAFVYTPGSKGKAEAMFSSTVKGYDLSEAKKVSFYIMGDKGDEVVSLEAGGKKTLPNVVNEKAQNFAVTTKPIKLTKQWQKLEIDLRNADLKDVTYPFGIKFTDMKNGQPVVMFVKWIKYESADPKNPIPVELPENARGTQ